MTSTEPGGGVGATDGTGGPAGGKYDWLTSVAKESATAALMILGILMLLTAYGSDFNLLGLAHSNLNTAEFVTINIVATVLVVAGATIRLAANVLGERYARRAAEEARGGISRGI